MPAACQPPVRDRSSSVGHSTRHPLRAADVLGVPAAWQSGWQSAGGDVGALALVGQEPRADGLGSDGCGDLLGIAGEQAPGLDGDPGFGRSRTTGLSAVITGDEHAVPVGGVKGHLDPLEARIEVDVGERG